MPIEVPTATIAELQKRISVLERKVSREKKARNIAENKLEHYSLEIYQINESLKEALASSNKKKRELEFLGKSSIDAGSEMNINEIITHFIVLAGEFCHADFGCYLVTDGGVISEEGKNQVWCSCGTWQEKADLVDATYALLPIKDAELMNSWGVSNIYSTVIDSKYNFKNINYTNFSLGRDKIAWLVLLNSDDNVDSDILTVLDTAREHLINVIRRRLADNRILKRNKQLQESLENLEKTRRQLIQSEKMASLGQLAAGVAHEINNPIAFVRSNMEVLQEYLNDYKMLYDNLKLIVEKNKHLSSKEFKHECEKVELDYIAEDSVDLLKSNIEGLVRVKEIVDNLKSFSHSGGEELTAITLADCVTAALKVTNNVFKYEHQIDNQLVNVNAKVLGNLGQLQQVFVNLFVNAAHAMEGGGKLTISHCENEEAIVIRVTDTGQGMDQKTVSQLFTPFFTTKPIGVGTGLGLSVSYAILEAHDANISVDSEVGVGTTFNLSFPLFHQD